MGEIKTLADKVWREGPSPPNARVRQFTDLLDGRVDLAGFEIKTDVEATVIQSSVDVIRTAGHTSAGDGGRALYKRSATEPSHAGKIQSADGAWWELATRRPHIRHFGARPSSEAAGTDTHTAAINALGFLNAVGGGTLRIDDGEYEVSGSVLVALTASVTIEFGEQGKLSTPSGTNPLVFNLYDTTASAPPRLNYELTFINPRIDVSAGTGGTGNEGTAISVTGFRRLNVLGGHLVAGDGIDGGHGDTGITPTGTQEVLIDGTHIIGFDDNGIYVSGGSDLASTDDGWTVTVRNPFIEYCANGINSKRQYHHMRVDGGAIRFCRAGIASEGADTSQQPGRRLDVNGTFIEKTIRYPINVDGPTKCTFVGVRIEDFGYEDDGVTAFATPKGIYLEGVSEAHIADTRIEMNDWSQGGSHIGLYAADATIFGTAYTAGKLTTNGNRFKGLDTGVDDSGAGDRSVFSHDHFDDVTTKYNLLGTSLAIDYTDEGVQNVRSQGNYPIEYRNGVRSFGEELADDAATSWQLPIDANVYLITVGTGRTGTNKPNGTIWGRRNTPILVDVNSQMGANVTLTTGALTGTTGTDTHTTISMETGGILHIENRTGATENYSVLIQPVG